jgi:ABC-type oligopeptide transport system substrate-binding subunit
VWAAHAYAQFGDILYPPGFKHFSHVNPVAPKGGDIALVAPTRASSFDKYNPFTMKGTAPPGLGFLMFETLLPNLSELMRWIGTTYTVRYNRKRGRVGHLFQGRYRAEVVDKESYTKRLILYIHMNGWMSKT